MYRLIRTTSLAAAAVFVSIAGSSELMAQATPGAATTCMSLLTADEVTQATGAAMEDTGGRARSAGETECAWMLKGQPGGLKSVSVQFYDMTYIKATPAMPDLDKFFEGFVAAGELTPNAKREMLPGIGQKAAYMFADPQMLVVVQRADGVARIVGNNLTKAQITAIARAVATP